MNHHCAPLPCPNCIQPMSQETLKHVYGKPVTIDACYPCHLFWFDNKENIGLAASSVLQVLELIHDHGHRENHSVKPDRCPRCDLKLKKIQDKQRNTPFFYYQCIGCKSHAINFFEVMKEKNFVRVLNDKERAKLAAAAQKIHCSSCGAPADFAREERCQFCEAPFSYLDPDQLHRALKEIRQDIKLEEVTERLDLSYADASHEWHEPKPWLDSSLNPAAADLFDIALDVLGDLLS